MQCFCIKCIPLLIGLHASFPTLPRAGRRGRRYWPFGAGASSACVMSKMGWLAEEELTALLLGVLGCTPFPAGEVKSSSSQLSQAVAP